MCLNIWCFFAGCLKLDLIDHTGIISDLSFALDGSLRLVSASHDSTLKLWDFEDGGNLIRTLKSKAKINGCAWSPDSKMVASVGDRKTVSDHSALILKWILVLCRKSFWPL